MNKSRLLAVAVTLVSAALAGSFSATQSRAQSPAAGQAAPEPLQQELTWPRVIKNAAETLTVYQPQIEQWSGDQITTRAAVAVQPADGSAPTYGVVWMTAQADVDKAARVVTFQNFDVTKVSFPTAPDKEAAYAEVLHKLLPTGVKTVALDHLEASLALSEAVKKQQGLAVKNDVPRILFTTTPTILVLVDGPPALRPMAGLAGVERVLNTRALIVKLQGRFYLTALNFWYQAPAIEGPWTPVEDSSQVLAQIKDAAAETKQVDLMQPEPGASAVAPPPAVRVSTVPTELIQCDGPQKMLPIEDTDLLQVQNSDDAVFMNLQDNQFYVLLSGRWFRSVSLYGPWEFVPAATLPADFAKIPSDHSRANALVSVPSTPQAKEALIANSIPQTASVVRAAAQVDVVYDGPPQFQEIAGTTMQYAVNCQLPVIRTGPYAYYCVQNGVWFTANSPTGPWVVATSVPPQIYNIPASSPLHYVTYVYVYGSTPEVVFTGYTPGYLGTCISTDGTVVYGTGYAYSPYCGTEWVGYPCTYGFSAGFACDTDFGFGFGFAISPFFPGCRPRPWWGPFRWGRDHDFDYDHVRLDHVNIYRHWDHGEVRRHHHFEENHWAGNGWSNTHEPFNPYSARPSSAGGRNWAANAERHSAPIMLPRETAAGRPSEVPSTRHMILTPPNSVYAGKSGEVFRESPAKGWEHYTPKGWQNAGESPSFRTESPSLNRERNARDLGSQRFDNWQSSGGFQSSGGGSGSHGGSRGR